MVFLRLTRSALMLKFKVLMLINYFGVSIACLWPSLDREEVVGLLFGIGILGLWLIVDEYKMVLLSRDKML